MRSLSSTVSEMPSSWLPSRSVVSKISTASGRSRVDMFVPIRELLQLAPDGGEVALLDLPGDRTGLTDLAVVDRADRHHFGRGTGEERLFARVEIAAEDVRALDLESEIAGDGVHRVLRDAFQRTRGRRRREDAAPAHDEEVL